MKKSKITFAVPSPLRNELQKRVINDGYGLRGKSKWVSESILNLFEYENHIDLISYGDEFHGLDSMETVVVDANIKVRIENKVIDVRRKYPELEGVKSRILRTAIVQRLLR